MTLLDGFNILHVVPELNAIFRQNNLTAMTRLAGMISDFPECRLIYDGNPPPGWQSNSEQVKFVRYEGQHFEHADTYILEMLERHRGVTVVTNDGALADRCRQKGATVLSPVAWYQSFQKKRAKRTSPASNGSSGGKQGPGGTPSEWVKMFKNRRPDDDPD